MGDQSNFFSAPKQVAETRAEVSQMSGQHSMQQCWDTLGITQFSHAFLFTGTFVIKFLRVH